ncbi:CheR family methyltransferase [Oligoflexus tunisiensis]|uniref:CheR family methyltransferase n=1 Tax=Oligoflexus tunisiensis TaxID=708132 RepID=UPI001C405CEB|nr:protein-glutamate O-methyltransferase CheR [Oligoflexus tunisiensis]
MSSRLLKLRNEGIFSYRDLLTAIESHDNRILHLFVSAMTTNTTHFFREEEHFQILTRLIKDQVQSLPRGSQPDIRVWCAASSTGEEPYALAMVLHDLQNQCIFTPKILATDVDFKVLAKARTAIYSEKQVENVPPGFLDKYFTRFQEDGARWYRVDDSLKSMVQFGRFNLLKNYPFRYKFDVIFCRNVLIYFERETVQYVIRQMTQVLQPGGHLFLGHSEAVAGMFPGLKRAGPAVYRWEPT